MMTKRMDPTVDVTIIREEAHFLTRCAVPFIAVEQATVAASVKDDGMFHLAGINLVKAPAVVINRNEKIVTTTDGASHPYDKLILATGGESTVPPIPGVGLRGVFAVRWSSDAVNILNWMKERNVQDVVVYGAGACGLEMASLIAQKGAKVTLVARSHLGKKAGFDADMGGELEKYFAEKGMAVRTNTVFARILGETEAVGVELSTGEKIDTGMVIIALGVRPRAELASTAGLEIGEYGVRVNEYLQTSDPDIYAGGDLIEYESEITGKPALGQIRPNAVIGGRIAAKNILGYNIKFPRLLNSFAAKVFDKSIASVGISEAQAKGERINVFAVKKVAKSKHAMIQGAKPYTIKLVFDRNTKKIIGAQIIADADCSVRYIDAIAVAIQSRWTALDMTTLRCAGHPELSPEPSAEPIALAAEDAFKELYPLPG